jgi:hypothetical protein
MRTFTSNNICHPKEDVTGLISTIATVEAQIVTIIMHGRKLHACCIDPFALGPYICSSGVHSARSVGFDRAKMIGRSFTLEIASMTWSKRLANNTSAN